jgi:phosphoglycolate phosphatase
LKRSKRLIILDLDGTLVDSLTDIAASVNHTAEKLGFPTFLPDTVRSFVGDGVQVLIERAFPMDESVQKEALPLFLSHYKTHLVDGTRLFPGIEPLLLSLKQAGCRMGILSNKLENLSRKVVASFTGLADSISFIYGGDSFKEKKPSPVPILEIMKRWGGDEENTVMIGDSPNDIRAGKAAGIHTIGVTYGFVDGQVLRKENPDLIVDSPAELQHAIECLIRR